ncbi:MAG: hypothetical protein KZQ66_14060, partial [Candidatus Thiodiazotropha sp. (ex Lucinoma aequizonata)]|nr:hypothetical protein [Candidatus Thiodiazotropha sp. (ex Lucinoma aequizonata)]MCU7900514.1 hypothetical protein [Candidatus Thiodiazotropha sp. (ex Lucinoma aequizonata)]MCU7902979.1 hypothetical protein [Candidatus Thiodiazotropha sp. (ex Lucinoma aequizonata)]MCU7907926.1 hypothetical protein [Candidatus Thiodiazotropha sp. (ex Lucinoma aequizonata)]MCU7911452.1 hypothetical protein [Candidatus Thiodiazotropha sp. (ex Lucinoma aequizonata)]
QGFSDPLVALVLKLDIRGPIQEGTDLVQGLNLLVVHIKSLWVTIMNRNSLLSDSFHVGIKSFVQTHFILDKAHACPLSQSPILFCCSAVAFSSLPLLSALLDNPFITFSARSHWLLKFHFTG